MLTGIERWLVWLGILRLGNISCQTSAKTAAARRRVALQRRWLSMQHDVNLLPVGLVQQGNVADVSCFNSVWDVLKASGACWGWEHTTEEPLSPPWRCHYLCISPA